MPSARIRLERSRRSINQRERRNKVRKWSKRLIKCKKSTVLNRSDRSSNRGGRSVHPVIRNQRNDIGLCSTHIYNPNLIKEFAINKFQHHAGIVHPVCGVGGIHRSGIV